MFESLGATSLLADAPAAARLASTSTGAPLRTAFLFFPNGAIPSTWWPTGAGTDFQWSRTLRPLENHKSHVQILGELEHKTAEPGPDGAGDHARGNGTFLTGVRLQLKPAAAISGPAWSFDHRSWAREPGHLDPFSISSSAYL